MTKNEFINYIKRRIDRNKSLPITLGNDEIEDIIIDAKKWFYDNYNDACYEFITLIPHEIFRDPKFITDKYIEFGECVYSVYELFENKGNMYSVSRLRTLGSVNQMIVNTLQFTKTYDIVTYVANMAYESVLTNLTDKYISYSWNKNNRRAHIIGKTPRTDLVVKGYMKVEETALFEDDLFRKYVEGQARIAIGEILSMYDFQLPNVTSINADSYISRGEEMIDAVKEDVANLIQPDWFMHF
jgi:hypothetical protein